MECRHDCAINGKTFVFSGLVWMCLVVIGRETSSKMVMGFLFHNHDLLSCKAMCTITTKQHNYLFLLLDTNIQHVRAGFALSTIIDMGSFVG